MEKGEILFNIGDSNEINFIYGRKNAPFMISEDEDENFEHTLQSFQISTGDTSDHNENDKEKLDFLRTKGVELGNSSIKSMFYLNHPFTFFIKKKSIALSSIIRDEANNIVFELDKGEWALKKNNNFSINYDDSAIEIIDSKGYVRFQIEVIENTFIYKGLLYNNDGVLIFTDAEVDGKLFIPYSTPNFEYYLDNSANKNLRIFKHVGSKYLKTRVSHETLKREYARLRDEKIFEVRKIFIDYSKLSNEELSEKTRAFTNKLIDLNKRWKTIPEGGLTEGVFLEHTRKMEQEYKNHFKVEAIALRYELDYRTKNHNSNLIIEDFYNRENWTTPKEVMKDLETLLFFLENNKDYSKLSNFELKEKIDLIIKNLDILAKKYGDNYYISKDFMTEYEQNIKKELISLLFQIKNKKGIVGSYFENYEYQKYENYLLKSEHFGYSFNNLIPELETYSKILVQLK